MYLLLSALTIILSLIFTAEAIYGFGFGAGCFISVILGTLCLLALRYLHIAGVIIFLPLFAFLCFVPGATPLEFKWQQDSTLKFIQENPACSLYRRPASLGRNPNLSNDEFDREQISWFFHQIEQESAGDIMTRKEARWAIEAWFRDHRYPKDGAPTVPPHVSTLTPIQKILAEKSLGPGWYTPNK